MRLGILKMAAAVLCLVAADSRETLSNDGNEKEAEKRIVDYLKANLKPGQPLVVTKLYNEVFTQPEERKALDRLYNIFFKVPAFVAQYYTASKKPPSLQEIAHQFDLPIPGEVDLILRIVQFDNRVPKFIGRDPQTGEITSVDVEKIKADPRFSKIIERSIAGWEGKVAPGFSVASLNGSELRLDQLKGKTRLIYFWFTGCPPCVQITPHLVALQQKFGKRDFTVIGLNADRLLELDYSDQDRKAYLGKHKIDFPVGHLSSEVQAAYGGVQLFPTLFLVDKEGIIRGHFVNYQELAVLEKAVAGIL